MIKTQTLYKAVRAQQLKKGIPTAQIAETLRMSEGNVRKILREESISYDRLVKLFKVMKFTDEEKLELL